MKNRKTVILVVVLAFIAGSLMISCSKKTGEKQLYQCPMHPQIVQDRPGSCPICGMDLVVMEKEATPKDSGTGETGGRAEVYISKEKQEIIGIRAEEVVVRELEKVITAPGTVVYDPELYYSQQEYISAYKSLKNGQQAAKSFMENSAIKLQSLGFSKAQIKELESKDEPDRSLLINEGGTGAWVYAQVFQDDIEFIKRGQKAKITGRGIKGSLEGTVLAIDPVLNPETRSVKIRILVKNRVNIRQESYVDVSIKAPLGNSLSVPEEAVINTGKSVIVFVDKGNGHFEPRSVETGGKAGGYYIVENGLSAGERVVVKANFLVDSESRLKADQGQ